MATAPHKFSEEVYGESLADSDFRAMDFHRMGLGSLAAEAYVRRMAALLGVSIRDLAEAEGTR